MTIESKVENEYELAATLKFTHYLIDAVIYDHFRGDTIKRR